MINLNVKHTITVPILLIDGERKLVAEKRTRGHKRSALKSTFFMLLDRRSSLTTKKWYNLFMKKLLLYILIILMLMLLAGTLFYAVQKTRSRLLLKNVLNSLSVEGANLEPKIMGLGQAVTRPEFMYSQKRPFNRYIIGYKFRLPPDSNLSLSALEQELKRRDFHEDPIGDSNLVPETKGYAKGSMICLLSSGCGLTEDSGTPDFCGYMISCGS